MPLACATGCVQRRHHLTDCPCADPQHEHGHLDALAPEEVAQLRDWEQYLMTDSDGVVKAFCPRCDGCLPRLAALNLAVCDSCERSTRDGLTELPDLWVDLAERPTLTGLSSMPTGDRETPDPMSDSRRQARSAIKAMLVAWCFTLHDDNGITVPDEHRIAASTRNLAAWHSDQARQARDAAYLAAQPHWDPSLNRDVPPDPAVATSLKNDEHHHAKAAATSRDNRETSRDILIAICRHITDHLGTLLAGEHADQLVTDVRTARSVSGMAYPTRGHAIRVRCDCGEHVPLDTSSSIAVTTCRTCAATGTLDEWRDRHQTIPDGPRPLSVLKDWLHGAFNYDIPIETLRTWTKRNHPGTDQPLLADKGRDDKGRRLYEPLDVVDLAANAIARRATNAA